MISFNLWITCTILASTLVQMRQLHVKGNNHKLPFDGCVPPGMENKCNFRISDSDNEIRNSFSDEELRPKRKRRKKLSVGIVGAGMAGLYAGLLLQKEDIDFHIFEAQNRVGGRIYTYHFNFSKNQYFEAGAMRIPVTEVEKPVFDLIDYLNEQNLAQNISLIDYIASSRNNFIYMNGERNSDGSPYTRLQYENNPSILRFPGLSAQARNRTAVDLYYDATGKFHKLYRMKGPECVLNCDEYTMRSFLMEKKGWTDAEVSYVETMMEATHSFDKGFIANIGLAALYSVKNFKTIKDGMSKLPEACQKVIGKERISLGAQVTAIIRNNDSKLTLYYTQLGIKRFMSFDRLILATPPNVVQMLTRPRFRVKKERALRSLHSETAYKIGLRFKSRFWERGVQPSFGGVSVKDLPTRWFLYPNYGIRDSGPGVLVGYNYGDDSVKWLTKTDKERETQALRDLSLLYGEALVHREFIESKVIMQWYPFAYTLLFPGEFTHLYPIAKEPEENIYFAGTHLDIFHSFFISAVNSALTACKQLLNDKELQTLKGHQTAMTYS